jgi:predicted acylesterase/phospholipase RssA
MSMVDAAHASSAVPTYFEPVRAGARTLVDGGVFAVNPAALACTGVTAEIDVLASVGTGQHRPLPFAEVEDWGAAGMRAADPRRGLRRRAQREPRAGPCGSRPWSPTRGSSRPPAMRRWAWRLSAMR